MGRKLYVTVNTVFEDREADRIYQLLKYLAALGPDGLIVQDFGVLKMARDCFPSLKIHASTQMNIASSRGANFLSKQGLSRVVLARELSLEELREIRSRTNMEMEIFVHGALCMSASGLCLFSSFLGGKSANRGMCTQACRRLYYPREGQDAEGPGGYYFSPSDLQLLEAVPVLADLGINAFKIEGRMKSAEYVGAVVAAYRRVIDSLDGDREGAIREAQAILHRDFARKKTRFLFDGQAGVDGPAIHDWLDPEQAGGTGIPLGSVQKTRSGEAGGRLALIGAGDTVPAVGDTVRFHRADDSDRRSLKIKSLEPDRAGLWIPAPPGFEAGDPVYLIQTKAMSRRYPPVIPRELGAFRRVPGRERAPGLAPGPGAGKAAPVPGRGSRRGEAFPPGFYAAVSRIEDLYILQSIRPAKAILGYTSKTGPRLLDKGLPFGPGEMILALDPWFPEDSAKALERELPALLERGYRQFIVNNPGQISLFKPGEAALIAGPWLYTFNRWSWEFIASQGLDYTVSPLENNRQNLERTVPLERRRACFVPLFAWPPLFRIRSNLKEAYSFTFFRDGREGRFRLITGEDGSRVLPERPFSIIDKAPFLERAGFRRFILDFSGPALKKQDYRDIVEALKTGARPGARPEAQPLPDTSRFNWKDGFYHEAEGGPQGGERR
jgi:putative protease